MSPPESSRQWVVLASVPVVVDNKDEQAQKILPGTDVLFDFQEPPRASFLVLPSRIAPDPKYNNTFPYIIATHPSGGRLLFHATQGRGIFNTAYFLCDAHARTATLLPDSQLHLKLRPRRSIGLAPDPRHAGHYMVAQLHPTSSKRHDTLLFYSTHTREWAVKPLASSPDHNPWGAHGVFSHGGMLWWVDVAYGMLACDPFADRPDLRFVPLPVGIEINDDPGPGRVFIDTRRFVRPCGGKLRFVEIHGLPYDPLAPVTALPDNTVVSMWTLVDPDGPHHWNLDYQAPFSDIWADDTYIAAGLPPHKVPALALLHPDNHEVLYFFHGSKLFAVDMRARRVMACEECLIQNHPEHQFQTSRFVDAWKLPPTLLRLDPSTAGMKGSDDEESSKKDQVMGSETDEELASLLSQRELKSEAGKELSFGELMSMLKDMAPPSEGADEP